MGKLAVLFFAALAFQAAFGGVTKGLGHDRTEIEDLVRQVVDVSKNLYETLHDTPLRQSFTWQNREFGQEIEEVIKYLEILTNELGERSNHIVTELVHELRELRAFFKELTTANDETSVRKLEVKLATTIKNVVKFFEAFEEIVGEEKFNHVSYTNLKTSAYKYVLALKKLYDNVKSSGIHTMYTSEHTLYGDEDKIEKGIERFGYGNEDVEYYKNNLEVVLERIHFEDGETKFAYMHLIRRYFEKLNEVLTFDFEQYYQMFFYKQDSSFSAHDVKTNLVNFVKAYLAKAEHVPQHALESFLKATGDLVKRFEMISEVNTPVRHLTFNVQATANQLTNWYESLPFESGELQETIYKQAKQLIKTMLEFVEKIGTSDVHPKLITNVKKFAVVLENKITKHNFVVFIQETTTEVTKLLISQSYTNELKIFVGTEYLNALEGLFVKYESVGETQDIDLWYSYIMATVNRFSLYMKTNIHSEDWKVLSKAFDKIFELLEEGGHPEHAEIVRTLKATIREFDTEKYLPSTFLQKVSLQLAEFTYTVIEKQGHVPKVIYEALSIYGKVLEKLVNTQRVIKGLGSVQTPLELTLKMQTTVERINKALHVMVPGLKQDVMPNRVHYFNQVIELVLFRLRMNNQVILRSDESFKTLYENIQQIQNHLKGVIERTDLNTKVNFGVYIQKAFMEMRRFAFEHHFVGNTDLVKIYGDFLFGLEYLLNQLQFELQRTTEQYPVKTLSVQLQAYGHRIAHFLERIQPKPELKRLLLVQVEALAFQIIDLSKDLRTMGDHDIFETLASKYGQIYGELNEVAQNGWSKSVEELCVFLQVRVDAIVRDFGYLTPYSLETSELYSWYTYLVEVFGNIMVRLENVHDYEYYHVIVSTPSFRKYIKTLTHKVSSKLQHDLINSEEIKYDLAFQTMKFARRLSDVALRFQIEAKINPTGLHHIINELQRVGGSQSVSVNELTHNLNKYVVAAYTEIEKVVSTEGYVNVREAIIKYIVAVEKLYFNINGVWERINHNESAIHVRIEMHVHYLLKAIEHIGSENKIAYDVLRAKYQHLITYVEHLLKNTPTFGTHAGKFEHVLKKLTHVQNREAYDNLEELKVDIIETIKYVAVLLKEMTWELHHGNVEFDVIVKTLLNEFLTVVQRIYLGIEINVLLPESNHYFNKWGLTTTGSQKWLNEYETDHYTTSTKYHNDLNKYTGKTHFYGDDELEYNNHNKWSNKDHSATLNKPSYSTWNTHLNSFHTLENAAYVPHFGAYEGLERPQYFGKFEKDFDTEYTPKFFYENTYTTKGTKDVKTLLHQIKNIASEVTEQLKEVAPIKVQDSISIWARQLLTLWQHVATRFEQENTTPHRGFENILEQLETLIQTSHNAQSSRKTYQLTTVIDQIVEQLEKIVYSEKYDEENFKSAFVQFYNYICNINEQINNFHSHGLEPYHTVTKHHYE